MSATSLATTAIDGLEVFIRATMVSAAMLSDRTCNRGATPSHATNHALSPNRIGEGLGDLLGGAAAEGKADGLLVHGCERR